MQFWPLGIVIVGSGAAAIAMIVVMIKLQRPGASTGSPHHRTNLRSDLIAAHDHNVAVEQNETATFVRPDSGSLADHAA